MAVITQARLYGPAQPGTVDTTIYTAPAGTSVIIKEIVIANTTAAAATITLAIGVAGTAANALLQAYSVPANSTVVFALSTVLNAADALHALQGTASAITVTVSGVTVV